MFTEKKIDATPFPSTSTGMVEMIPAPPHPSRRFLRNFLINLAWALPWAVGVLYLAHRAMGLNFDDFVRNVIDQFVAAANCLTLKGI